MRRRGSRRFRPALPPGLPAGLLELVREHAAWSVLDAARVERLLACDPRSLDPVSRVQVWRLVTVFLAEPPGGRSDG